MRYSLLSRFQGALLGAAVGEILGTNNQLSDRELFIAVSGESVVPPRGTQIEQRTLHQSVPRAAQQLSGWGCLTMRCAQNLIGRQKQNFSEWPLSQDQLWPAATVVTLPLMLFFHDSEAKLREELARAVADRLKEPAGFDGMLAVGYAIAQALKEKLNSPTIIPKIIRYLHNSDKTDQQADAKELPMVKQLREIRTLLTDQAGLVTAVQHLSGGDRFLTKADVGQPNSAIALALYCVMSTPEDFRLSVIRASRSGCEPQLTGAIAGALSGAYNGIAGIPISWRRALQHPNSKTSGLLKQLWGIDSEAYLLQLATQILAAWSGIYDPVNPSIASTGFIPISAPGVIKPR